MANIEKIRPGQILHDYHRQKAGNSRMTREGHWLVRVIEIDLIKRRAWCSWNNNPPDWLSETAIKKLRIKAR